jgi:galactokinase
MNLSDLSVKHGAAMATKVEAVSSLYQKHFGTAEKPVIAVAPGRVNLIGEHTDYTGGFVLPFAIDYSTVVYGSGSVKSLASSSSSSRVNLEFVSSQIPSDKPSKFTLTKDSQPPVNPSWTTYVCGTVHQYLEDLPEDTEIDLQFSIASDVPLGSGLSSSASLEVSVARFIEEIVGEEHAFSSATTSEDKPKVRALRCQKAENTWCQSPCGIMDQFISSAASSESLLLIDCTSLEVAQVKMSPNKPPVIVVANSNVKHDIGGGEYPIRVQQCQTATKALGQVNSDIQTLRQATLEDVERAKDLMDRVSYQRAKHVVTENDRVLQAKQALEHGDWSAVGKLMNDSHKSMRDDYEVSCEEIDILVNIARSQKGVYGSRLTGGGFGGCTVSLVESKEDAVKLIDTLQRDYKSQTGNNCDCFQTQPAQGAHIFTL